MSTSNTFMTVEQQGSTLGQSAVGPSFLDATFHRAQSRLKNRKAGGDVKGGDAVRPLFCPELATEHAKDNDERWLDY